MFNVFILEMKYVMKNVPVQNEDIVKYIVNVIKYYANLLIMDAIVLKEIVLQIIAHAS